MLPPICPFHQFDRDDQGDCQGELSQSMGVEAVCIASELVEVAPLSCSDAYEPHPYGQPLLVTSILLLSCSAVPRRPVIEYQHAFEFAATPEDLWETIQEVHQFQEWWPWLEEFRLEGDTLQAGSVLHGVVAPPLPYRMRIRVELADCEPPTRIDAIVHGDLEGVAWLEMRPSEVGTIAEVAWTVEMMPRPMRLASRVAHPLLQWGHDRVVEITVAGFRRRLESAN